MTSHAADLILVVHHHQPVGAPGATLGSLYVDTLRPVLDAMARRTGVRFLLHHSGAWLEWLAEHQGGYLKDVRALVENGQVEVLGGGFYGPILSSLPEADVRGQLEMMASFCDSKLGWLPQGVWLDGG